MDSLNSLIRYLLFLILVESGTPPHSFHCIYSRGLRHLIPPKQIQARWDFSLGKNAKRRLIGRFFKCVSPAGFMRVVLCM